MGPGLGAGATVAPATGASGTVSVGTVRMVGTVRRASRRVVYAGSTTAVGDAGSCLSGATAGVGATGVGTGAIRLVAAAVGMRRASRLTRSGPAAAGRGAGPAMALTAAAADLADCAPAGAARSAPTADRRGEGASAEFPDRDAESDSSAEAEAEVLRPMTIPAPSAAAKPPTRPTKPAAVMARSITGCRRRTA